MNWEDDLLMYTLDTNEEFNYFIFNSVKDANGKDIYEGISSSYREDGNKQKIGISIPAKEQAGYENPINWNYPSFLPGLREM
ncbi:hypothetical protein [Cytobacillus sp. NCCP-133]|uniref:hypothetical protein n=1 Tax=Cytobacillus sp. NCCP-133 TaxID=766848 RepID=UPI0022304243|nr:hypothetical protein [Cytobacillus sp. NCCP-133]GLB59760.1 hypothetical protein NCCP133_18920 [Cytobacillus sp. NCCP-133]